MGIKFEGRALECVRGGRGLFRDLHFSLADGEMLEVSGANGSGKTSLLRMLCGLMAPASGEIFWDGRNISSIKEEYLATLAYLGHANGLKSELSVAENLRIHLGLAGADADAATAALERVGLGGFEAELVGTLSQGQKRRLALSRLLIAKRSLWVLDEPLAALDAAATKLVRDVLEEHLGGGGLAVLTTHQPLEVSGGRTVRLRLEFAREV